MTSLGITITFDATPGLLDVLRQLVPAYANLPATGHGGEVTLPVLDDGSVQLPLVEPEPEFPAPLPVAPRLDRSASIVTPEVRPAKGLPDPDAARAGKRPERRPVSIDAIVPSALGGPATIKPGDTIPAGWILTTEAAPMYGCAYPTLMNRCADGKIPSVKIGGRRYVPPPTT